MRACNLFPGELTALVGENGAGKSTLVKLITGIYQPDTGEMCWMEEDCGCPRRRRRSHAGITAIHQETVLFEELSVAETSSWGTSLAARLAWWTGRPCCQRIARSASPGSK